MFSLNCIVKVTIIISVLFAGQAAGQCLSLADSTPVDYLEYRDGRFTICYSPTYPDDLELAKTWVNRAFEIGSEKYGVLNPTYGDHTLELTVYLPPNGTQLTSQGNVRMACCYGGETSFHAEVHYLTPSAWVGDSLGGLQRSPEHYHPHYLIHEITHFFQLACCGLDAPSWITEGMSESDGYRYTTDWNAAEGIDRLTSHFISQELGNVVCCRDLGYNLTLGVSSVYWAGGWIMWYLAENYGEQIHVELLLDSLSDVLAKYDVSLDQFYSEIRGHIQSWTPSTTPRSTYTPNLACTGRWRQKTGGSRSFEVQILNNQERSEDDTLFQSQHRSKSTLPWTTKSSLTGVPLWIGHSNFSTPLFYTLPNPSFQWRARTCPQNYQIDNTCSNWSNIVNWTTASCATIPITIR